MLKMGQNDTNMFNNEEENVKKDKMRRNTLKLIEKAYIQDMPALLKKLTIKGNNAPS